MCIKVQLNRLCLRRFTLVAAVCSAIIVILTIATANAGVRVRYADLNPSELTNADGQIVLHMSVPIKRVTPEQVSLTAGCFRIGDDKRQYNSYHAKRTITVSNGVSCARTRYSRPIWAAS